MAETESTTKDHLTVEIKSPNLKSISTSKNWDESFQEQTITFFGSRSRRKKANTWIISLFVVLHLVAFAATMVINDCPSNSNGHCVFRVIGRVSFQPLSENPLLGPSSSTLVRVGSLQRNMLAKHQIWRLITSPFLHAGLIDLVINLAGIIFIGIHLEQEFGPLRIGIIYLLSAFTGSLTSSLFVQSSPAVSSSGALFGLLGATLSGLMRNWKVYSDKFAVLVVLCFITATSFCVGLLPHTDNFSSIGGFLSGFLLGFVLFFNLRLGQVFQNKKGIFEYKEKSTVNFKHMFDKPVLRSISLIFFSLILAGGLVAVLHGVNGNKYCSWCHYVNCIPSERWSCNGKVSAPCVVSVTTGHRTILTCKTDGDIKNYTFTNLSKARTKDLCSRICL